MAKKSLIARERRRLKLVAKYFNKRKDLKTALQNPNIGLEERNQAQKKLQLLPRDASPTRIRNRCGITGRPHGFYRKFGLSRNKLRESVMRGDVPGIVKASW